MGKQLLVILGAGAPFDLIPAAGGRRLGAAIDELWPPLTKDIFQVNRHTTEVLGKYPGAAGLVGSIRVDLHAERPLEPLLMELSRVTEGPRARQFPEIPLYLQDLFARISRDFTDQPINYARLADRLFASNAGFERMAFLTLNYDTLLEKVLVPSYLGQNITSLESYMGGKCLLVKLHGSVDWVRPLDLNASEHIVLSRYLEIIGGLGNANLPSALQKDIALRRPEDTRWSDDGRRLYYPALSVPLGEYTPVCPSYHLVELTRFLETCTNILVIGVSGRDFDLLRLLEANLPQQVWSFALVDGNRDAAIRARENFLDAVPRLRTCRVLQTHSDGFSSFILGDGLERYIEESG
jgi:hypothetical protein